MEEQSISQKKMVAFTILALILMLGVGIILGLVVSQAMNKKETKKTNTNTSVADESVDVVNENTNEEEEVEDGVNTNTTTNTNATVNADTGAATNDVTMTKIADLKLTKGPDVESATYYKVGTLDQEPYKGYDLILLDVTPTGPHFYNPFFRFAKKGDSINLLEKHSENPEYYLDDTKFAKDDERIINKLLYPGYIYGPKKDRQYLSRDGAVNIIFSEKGLKKAFVDETYGQVYTTDDDRTNDAEVTLTNNYNGFYIKGNDGTAVVYRLDFDFFIDGQQLSGTWDDGNKTAKGYTTAELGACGSTSYAAVIYPNEVNKNTELVQTGKSSAGDPLYELKDKNHRFLKQMYENYQPIDADKVSYDEFVKQHPMFFFVDSFDRLIKAQSTTFMPAAECGKPVVYLYPEKKENVSVKVNVSGGMSISIPEYKSGWDVVASPDGTLYHPATKQNYPYLFWEGRSNQIMPESKKGFVVKKDEVHTLLEEKLTKLGLNAQERADFEEFWEPRMQAAPYYFVTFLGKREMDILAPMNITPKPDTVIRLFMDFKPLQKPIEVEGYDIKTPERKGFTVVEWGGTLSNR